MRAAVAVALLFCACGGPVVDETVSPVGVVIDAVADPQVYEGCRATQAEVETMARTLDASCSCETECTDPDLPIDGRCVPREIALAPGFRSPGSAGACVDTLARLQRSQGCEVPVWPLARCASVD